MFADPSNKVVGHADVGVPPMRLARMYM